MSDSLFEITREGAVAHLVLNRPDKRNAMNRAFWDELPDTIRALDRDGTTRVILISSTGPHFSAGLDLNDFAAVTSNLGAGETDTHKAATRGLAFYENVKVMQDAFTALEDARVPVIAGVQGGCIGGGVDMVTACDMRLCTEDAYFTIYEVILGMTADVGSFPRLLNHFPEGIVRELAYTGRRMSAEEALRFGFVNRVFETQEAMLTAMHDLATDIESRAPMAVHGCKKMITHARDHSTGETLDYVALWNASMLQQSELMAAMVAKQTGSPGDFAPLPVRKKVSD